MFARSNATPRARLRQAALFQVEALERRVLLSSAIAAFNAQQAFPTGTNPLSLAVADVNRDGKLDLIVANNTDGNVGVLLGDGTGSFLNQMTFASGPTPIAVAVADVNGDGKPDILVANYGSSSVSVLLGNGNGTFQNPQSFATGNEPIALTTADVNGDGKQDILVANYSSGTVSVLDGNGDGTFQPQQTFAAGAHPISIAAADLNLDGKPDIAVSNYTSSTVSVLLGTGGGSFSSPQTFAVGRKPRSIVVSDINTDGKPDLIVVNKTDGAASILLGNGDGTFQAQITSYVGASPNAVAVADVNGDGKEDLIVADGGTTYPGTVAVLLGNRDGTFQPAVNFNTGANPYSVAVADLNDDGRLDIATANQRSNTASVLLGDVPPAVLSINRTSPAGANIAGGTVTYTVAFNEPVTGVGPTDFLLAMTGSVTANTPVVVSGSGAAYNVIVNGILGAGTIGLNLVDNGSIKDAAGNPLQPGGVVTFRPQQTISVFGYSVAVADLNGDGKPDLVYDSAWNGGTSANWLSVLLGNGDGTFRAAQTLVAGQSPVSVEVGDFNGDGKPDLVVANYSVSRTVSVLLGNGNGTFQAPQTFAAGSYPMLITSVTVADVNNDGKEDLVVATSNGGTINVLLGNGNGTFRAATSIATTGTGFEPRVVVADVNGDGRPDVMVADGMQTRTIEVFLGNGDGTFQPKLSTNIENTAAFAIADLNGDGKPDLISSLTTGLSIALGNGDGTFRAPMTFSTGYDAGSISAVDFNGDGKPDLIVDNSQNNGITAGNYNIGVMLGNGDGTFRPQVTFAAGFRPQAAVASDLNGDGKPDVVVADDATPAATVLISSADGSVTGQTYTVSLPAADTINGTSGGDQIKIIRDLNRDYIDWSTSFSDGQMLVNDPNGMTINGNGSNDVITLDYSNGDPLPGLLNFNGTFTINGLPGGNPLGGHTWNLNRSTLYISYTSADPLASIQGYLNNGYNNGAWNGTSTPVQQIINATGYNQDVIVEDGAANPVVGTSVGFDGSSVWYEQGYPGSDGTGLPSSGTIFRSATNPNVSFQLQPYTSNNVAFIPGGNGSVSLSLHTPSAFTTLDFLASAANGNATMAATLNFADGSTAAGAFTVSDWADQPNPALIAGGGIGRSTSSVPVVTHVGPRMYEYDFVVPSVDQSKLLTSVTFTETSGQQLGIFAISGGNTAAAGAITSAFAAANLNHTTGIGYADWADGSAVDTVPNTIELKYTLYGDANLDGQVNSADLQALLFGLNRPGAWDQGDFNYDGQVNSADLQALLFTLNTSLGSQATPMAIAATAAVTTPSGAGSPGRSDPSPRLVPAILPTGTTGPAVHPPHAAKVSARKRR
jgi:hypothetical protein